MGMLARRQRSVSDSGSLRAPMTVSPASEYAPSTRSVSGVIPPPESQVRSVYRPSSEHRFPAMLDASDFRALYDEHFDFVWRTFRRLGFQEADCFDASQEAFLTIRRKMHEFEGRSSLRTWIFGICVGTARNKRRALMRANRLRESESAIEVAQASQATAEHVVSLSDARRMLETILSSMSPTLRASFVMFELEQISAEEISEMLGVPPATVRSRVRLAREHYDRAVKRIRATMGDSR